MECSTLTPLDSLVSSWSCQWSKHYQLIMEVKTKRRRIQGILDRGLLYLYIRVICPLPQMTPSSIPLCTDNQPIHPQLYILRDSTVSDTSLFLLLEVIWACSEHQNSGKVLRVVSHHQESWKDQYRQQDKIWISIWVVRIITRFWKPKQNLLILIYFRLFKTVNFFV